MEGRIRVTQSMCRQNRNCGHAVSDRMCLRRKRCAVSTPGRDWKQWMALKIYASDNKQVKNTQQTAKAHQLPVQTKDYIAKELESLLSSLNGRPIIQSMVFHINGHCGIHRPAD